MTIKLLKSVINNHRFTMTNDLKKEAKKALPSNASAALQKFLNGFLSKIPEEDKALIDPKTLVETAQIHL